MNEHVPREILSALADGECDPEERRYAHEHLTECDGCRKAAAEFTSVKGFVAGLPHLVAPESLVTTVLTPAPTRPRRVLHTTLGGRRRYLAAAVAAGALVVSLAGLAAPPEREQPPVEMFVMRHVGVNDGAHVGGQVLFAVNNNNTDRGDR